MEIVVLLAAMVALPVIWYVNYRRNQSHFAELGMLAMQKGWQFEVHDLNDLPGRWVRFPFMRGYDRRAMCVVSGKLSGFDLVAFDYQWKEDRTNSKGMKRTHRFTYGVTTVELPAWLPYLHVAPEGLGHKVGLALGVDDIDVELEDFNRRFRVAARDPKFALDVLNPRTVEAVLHSGAKHEWRIEGQHLICWAPGANRPLDLLARASLLASIADGIPDFVWKDYGAGGMESVLPLVAPVVPAAPASPPPQSTLPAAAAAAASAVEPGASSWAAAHEQFFPPQSPGVE